MVIANTGQAGSDHPGRKLSHSSDPSRSEGGFLDGLNRDQLRSPAERGRLGAQRRWSGHLPSRVSLNGLSPEARREIAARVAAARTASRPATSTDTGNP